MPPYNMDCSSHSDSYYNNNNNNQQTSSSNPSSPAKQPLHKLNKSTSNCETQNELLQLAALELESFRRPTSSANSSSSISSPQRKVRKQNSSNSLNSTNSNSSNESVDQIEETERAFPQACLHLLHTLSGNTKCHDCLAPSPSWASVSYGITLCLQCSGKHRSLGVNVSYVKSLTLDSWKRTEILCMLEGGNGQLDTFFSRHEMGSPQIATTRKSLDSPSNSTGSSPRGSPTTKNTVGVLDRYKTKAASFYRQHLKSHAKTIASKDGLYEGRDAHRNKKKSSSSSKSSKRRGDKSSSSSSGCGGNKGKTKLLGEKMKKGNEVVQQILESVTEVDIDSSCGSNRSAGFM